MRAIRLFLYFTLGFMFSLFAVIAHAETIPAVFGFSFTNAVIQPGGFAYKTFANSGPAGDSVCIAWSMSAVYSGSLPTGQTSSGSYPAGVCTHPTLGTRDVSVTLVCPEGYLVSGSSECKKVVMVCPSGQGWTLSGSTCSRPDCEGDQVRDSAGVCSCPSGKSLVDGLCKTLCPSGYHPFTPDDGRCEKDCIGNQFQDSSGVCKCSPSSNKVYALTAELGASPGCDGGCKTTSFMGTLYCPKSAAPLASVGSLPSGMTCYGYGGRTGEVCIPATPPRIDVKLSPLPPPAPVPPPVTPTPENPTPPPPDPKTTPDNNKDPVKCGESGGVFLEVGGQGKCASPSPDNKMDGVKVKAAETVTTNPDGSKTITTEKTINTVDPVSGEITTKKTTTTVNKDASGNVTGTGTSETNSGKGTGGDGDGEGVGQCAKEPNSPLCKVGKVPEKGKFTEGQDAKVIAAKEQLRAKFSEVKTSASAMFSGALGTGGGSLPCPPPITVLGKSWTICFSQYSDQLSMIGAFVMLAAAVGAAFIVLRR